jgi:hypothetical protein
LTNRDQEKRERSTLRGHGLVTDFVRRTRSRGRSPRLGRVALHLGTNQKARHKEPPLDLIVHATKDVHVQRSIGVLVMSGLFEQFEHLRVGAVEFGASWAAPLVQRLDELYVQHFDDLTYEFPDGELPSDHFRRNVFLSFQDDPPAVPSTNGERRERTPARSNGRRRSCLQMTSGRTSESRRPAATGRRGRPRDKSRPATERGRTIRPSRLP